MLRKRLLAGSILAAAIGGVLVADSHVWPYFPCLFVVVLLAGIYSTRELVHLIPAEARPSLPLCTISTLIVLGANWYHPLIRAQPDLLPVPQFADPWHPVFLTFTTFVIVAFLYEMYRYREPGHSVVRIALTNFSGKTSFFRSRRTTSISGRASPCCLKKGLRSACPLVPQNWTWTRFP